jgi:hypothetical protein
VSTPSIDLFAWATPNGWKASCTLDELQIYDRALRFKVYEQFEFEFDEFTLAYLRNEESEFELELTLNKGRTEPCRHREGCGRLAVCVNNCVHWLATRRARNFTATAHSRRASSSFKRRMQGRGPGEARPLPVTLRGVALQHADDQIARALHGLDVFRRRRQDDQTLKRYHH